MYYVDNFKLYLQTDRNSSVHTLSAYDRDISAFFRFKDTPEDIKSITAAHIRAYIAYLSGEGRARSSINRMLCSLKAFFNYLVDIEEIITKSPADSVKCGKKEKSLPKAISESDVTVIIDTAVRLKDRVIIELLYGLGGRVSEVANLKVEDIDFEESFIRIKGKGGKTRQNPIHAGCLDLIRAYMMKKMITTGYLFPSKLDKSKPTSRESLYKMTKRIAKSAGLDTSTVSPHVLRHSFATHMLDNGCDMALVQEYLGHEDIATTKIYAQVTNKNKKETFNKFHPLAK